MTESGRDVLLEVDDSGCERLGKLPICVGKLPICVGKLPICVGKLPTCVGMLPLCVQLMANNNTLQPCEFW